MLRVFRLVLLCGLAALTIAACGGARHRALAPGAAQASAATATQPPAATQPTPTQLATSPKPRATAPVKPSHSGSSTTATSPAPTAPQLAPRAPLSRFQYLASTLCQRAAGGAPGGRPPSDPRALRAYAVAALPATLNVTIALPRLAATSRRLTQVAPLMTHLETLLTLYRRAALGRSGAVSAGQIRGAQQAAAHSARAIHLAPCARLGGQPA